MGFIVFHVIWFAVWLALNLRSKGASAFDPFPFAFLTMIVSLESIFLSLFILMSQNRTGIQADQRNHRDFQINLLAENENTKNLPDASGAMQTPQDRYRPRSGNYCAGKADGKL